MATVGNTPSSTPAGDNPNPGRPLVDGPGPGPGDNPGRPRAGEYDGPKDAGETPEEKETSTSESEPVDLEGLWSSLPDFLKMIVLGLNNWAEVFNWYQDRVVIVFIPLTDKEAKTLASFARPYLEEKLPDFVKRNPGLAILMVPFFILLFKVRISLTPRTRKLKVVSPQDKEKEA